MKELWKTISIITASVLTVLVIFKLADHICNKFRKNYITIDNEYIHI
ncbi:MAG: hypothetical protein K2H93_04275 [Oscillospiraceae bacterium]|nr:hypothetical protein [Oscillospiraceae bacterium]